MKRLQFLRDFSVPELMDRKNCVLCKVWGSRLFRASDKPILVKTDQADAALKAGAAIEVRL